MSTVASYFDFETGTAKTESEVTALATHRKIFFVGNLEGVGFIDNKNKLVHVDPFNPAPRVTYFMFRSKVNGSAVDKRGSDISLFLEIALRMVFPPLFTLFPSPFIAFLPLSTLVLPPFIDIFLSSPPFVIFVVTFQSYSFLPSR